MAKKSDDRLSRIEQKLDYVDVCVKELLDQELDERLKAIESVVEYLQSGAKLLRSNQVLREDHRTQIYKSLTKGHRDKTVYLFQDELVRKKYLVLICLKHYVYEHNNITAVELIKLFPPTLRKTYGVIRPVGVIFDQNWEKCFHMKDEDILHFPDGDYAVCSAWDISNITPVLEVIIHKLGYVIEAYENGKRKDEDV